MVFCLTIHEIYDIATGPLGYQRDPAQYRTALSCMDFTSNNRYFRLKNNQIILMIFFTPGRRKYKDSPDIITESVLLCWQRDSKGITCLSTDNTSSWWMDWANAIVTSSAIIYWIQKQLIHKAHNSKATHTTLHRAMELCLCMHTDRWSGQLTSLFIADTSMVTPVPGSLIPD